jgi:5'-3' exonuclease
MILVDFSSILHRKIYTSLNSIKPKKQNDHFITSEYIGLTKYYILQELFDIQLEFKSKFGEMIICLDRAETGYWRKDFFPSYKSNRKSSREKSDINFTEV